MECTIRAGPRHFSGDIQTIDYDFSLMFKVSHLLSVRRTRSRHDACMCFVLQEWRLT